MSGDYYNYWKYIGNLPGLIRRYEEAVNGRNSSDLEHCRHNTRKNMAIIHIQIASSANDLINKITKSPSVTTADILSCIGNFLLSI